MSYFKYDGSLAVETPSAVNSQWGSTAGNETLVGTGGPDALTAGGPNELLVGGGGGDTFTIQASGAQIQEAAGGAPNQLNAWQNIDLANYANIQNLSIGGSNDYAVGNAQDNIIYVNGSHQQLYGGGGQDVLVGDGQSDTFIIVKGAGDDAIYGFNTASDVVRLSAGYSTFAQVQQHMTQVGADVNIDLGGGSAVVLRNVAASQLTAANFQLQLDAAQVGPMTFGDEFNNLSLWNGSAGTWATTFWYQDPNGAGGGLASNGEQEWYVNANYAPTAAVKPWAVANGALTLTAAPAPSAIQPLINNYQYTSGEVNTFHSFAQTYGYFEMRAQLPQNAGGWPAFWLLPADGSWPPELDVMETLTNDPHADYTTSHSAIGGNTYSQGVAFVPDTSSGFHTYGVLWTKTTLTWYVDGTEVYQTATPADMNKPMYMIANLALGGWGGAVDPSQLPAQMKIDYIHAYGLADGSSTVAYDTAAADPAGAGPDTGLAAGGGTTTTSPGTTTTAPPTTTTTTPPSSGGPVPAASSAGQVFTSPGPGSVETGGAGADTFYASAGGDTLTGGAGADVFVFQTQPWAPDHITDFQVGTDKLDLSALFRAAGYTGSDPVADHYIVLEGDGSGGTFVRFEASGQANLNGHWPNTIIDLEHVSPAGLTWSQLANPPSVPAAGSSGGSTAGATSGGGALSGGGGFGGGGGGSFGGATAGQALNAPVGGGALTGGAGPDTLAGAASGSNYLRGGDGADLITGGSGFNNVNGNQGDDTLIGKSQVGDWLLGGQGNDSITAAASTGHNIINGNLGADTIHAGSGGDSLRGGQGDDLLVGGGGADWLSGDMGHDTLTGGGGADTFHVAANNTLTVVTDFSLAQGDRIELDHGAQYSLTQSGANLVVTISGGGQLILDNVQQASLAGTNWIVQP